MPDLNLPSFVRRLNDEKKLTRSVTLENINVEARTVELSFSSEHPYKRIDPWDGKPWIEVLSHEKSAVNLDRLNTKAAFLWNHNWDVQLGVIEKAWIDAKKGRVIVKFSRSKVGDEAFQDVIDGIRTLVSVGYRINSVELQKEDEDVGTYLVTNWEPYEVSLVSVPADTTVGVGRADTGLLAENPTNKMSTPNKENETPAAAPAPVITTNERAVAAERERVSKINTLARKYNVSNERVAEFVNGDKSVADFQSLILEEKNGTPVPAKAVISESDLRKANYSIKNLINHRLRTGRFEGCAEYEFSQELERKMGIVTEGILIPSNARALNATVGTEGAYTIGTDKRPDLFVEPLRNQSAILRAGATFLTGLVGNIEFNRQTATATAEWLAENAQQTDSEMAFGLITMQPRRVGASTKVSKQLLAQSSLDVDGLIQKDLDEATALAIDLAALFGTGVGQPSGIFLDANVNTVGFGGAASWAKVIEFLTTIEQANYQGSKFKWFMNPVTYGKWQSIVKAGTNAEFLAKEGKANGYEITRSAQIPTTGTYANRVAFLDPSQVLIGEWAAKELIVDPYSAKKTYQVEITQNSLLDVALRQPKAVTRSTDSGNQ